MTSGSKNQKDIQRTLKLLTCDEERNLQYSSHEEFEKNYCRVVLMKTADGKDNILQFSILSLHIQTQTHLCLKKYAFGLRK